MEDHHKAMLIAHTMLLHVLVKHLRKAGVQYVTWEHYEHDIRKIVSDIPSNAEGSPELISEFVEDFLRRTEDET